MKNNKNVFYSRIPKGFTLIELLVVVLIIGILTAVALPQYNKAVKKSQGREVIVAINTLDKALAAYALQHGDICDGDAGHCHQSALDIDLPATTHFTQTGIVIEGYTRKGPTAVFESNTAEAILTATWDSTTGQRVSTTCTGADCATYFGGTCETHTTKTCLSSPVSDDEYQNCPPHYRTPDQSLTTCELDF